MGPGSDEFQVAPLAYGGDRDAILLLVKTCCKACRGKRVPQRPGEMPRLLQKVVEPSICLF